MTDPDEITKIDEIKAALKNELRVSPHARG